MENQNVISPMMSTNEWQTENVAYTYTDTYRTNDGSAFFLFGCLVGNDHVEIDLLHMPKCEFVEENALTSFIEKSDRGGYKVHVPEDKTVNEATLRLFLGEWAEDAWNAIRNQLQEII